MTTACREGGDLKRTAALAWTGFALGCAAVQVRDGPHNSWLARDSNLVTLADVAARGGGWRALLGQASMRGVLLLGIPAVLHLLLFAVHLAQLPLTGNGDNYLSERFQASLVGSRHAESVPIASRPGLLAIAWEHAQAQFWYNRNMAILFPRGSHPFDTAWYTWPLAARGIYFSLVADWNALASNIAGKHSLGFFLHPNPMITLLTTAAAAATAVTLLVRVLRCLLLACGSR